MQIKLLFIIANSDKKIEKVVNKFKLPFNVMTKAMGTASESLLNFFGLNAREKYVSMSIIPDSMEEDILLNLNDMLKINNIGNGLAFTINLSSSSKYVMDAFNDKVGENMEEEKKVKKTRKTKKEEKNYHLVITIVDVGCAEKVMNAAKRKGATGGTIINGRELGGKNSFKFFNITMEAEKDIVLIVCEEKNKNDIMTEILEKTGIKTEAKGLCISLPIENVVGLIDN